MKKIIGITILFLFLASCGGGGSSAASGSSGNSGSSNGSAPSGSFAGQVDPVQATD